MIDNRKSKRYAGKSGAFAVLIKQNEPIVVGQIIDISYDGISIRYLSRKAKGIGLSYIKLFAANGHFAHMKRIQCNIIYDIQIDRDSWLTLVTRRCGAKFEQLSYEMQMELQNFIGQHIVDPAYNIC
jgi:hypothetical protein